MQESNIPRSNIVIFSIIRLWIQECLEVKTSVDVKGPLGYFCIIIFTRH